MNYICGTDIVALYPISTFHDHITVPLYPDVPFGGLDEPSIDDVDPFVAEHWHVELGEDEPDRFEWLDRKITDRRCWRMQVLPHHPDLIDAPHSRAMKQMLCWEWGIYGLDAHFCKTWEVRGVPPNTIRVPHTYRTYRM